MLGHCAGLRNSQELGDYVLAHAYLREDHVLDADLPVTVPIPALAEVQVALEQAVGEITHIEGIETKRIMRTGTVATFDNRNWELRDQAEITQQLSQSRAVALDMESATIAANGFRFRVPYGTLLCVSDKPLHGELKLPGMASDFYRTQVNRHLLIGMRSMEILRNQPPEKLHSRKLRTFRRDGVPVTLERRVVDLEELVDFAVPAILDEAHVLGMTVVAVVGGLVGELHREAEAVVVLGADLPQLLEFLDAGDVFERGLGIAQERLLLRRAVRRASG